MKHLIFIKQSFCYFLGFDSLLRIFNFLLFLLLVFLKSLINFPKHLFLILAIQHPLFEHQIILLQYLFSHFHILDIILNGFNSLFYFYVVICVVCFHQLHFFAHCEIVVVSGGKSYPNAEYNSDRCS